MRVHQLSSQFLLVNLSGNTLFAGHSTLFMRAENARSPGESQGINPGYMFFHGDFVCIDNNPHRDMVALGRANNAFDYAHLRFATMQLCEVPCMRRSVCCPANIPEPRLERQS